MLSTIIIFVDGIGIGKLDYDHNPFFKLGFRTFSDIFGQIPHLKNQEQSNDGVYIKGIDACLNVPGIPQSGTGQTSIFCGFNAQKKIGKHFGPFPYSTLIPHLQSNSIFSDFLTKNLNVNFVNAYPKVFFDYLKTGKRRLGVIARMNMENKLRFNRITDLRKGRALSAEINNSIWVKRLEYNLRIIQPKTAAKRLIEISKKNHLTVYEHFLSDHFGHGRQMEHFKYFYDILDQFLFSVISYVKNENIALIICSDHGNLEDLSQKQHTLNPALFITAGKNAKENFEKISRIDLIKQAVEERYW